MKDVGGSALFSNKSASRRTKVVMNANTNDTTEEVVEEKQGTEE